MASTLLQRLALSVVTLILSAFRAYPVDALNVQIGTMFLLPTVSFALTRIQTACLAFPQAAQTA